MATIKHLAVKNRSYAFPLRYLTYQYDEHTNKPILDENKHMVLREEYLIDAVGVLSPSSFQAECESWNTQCKKNISDSEIKLHHYIISFDPKDKEKGLTPEKAQAIGMEIAEKYFAGCQALVCTHPDGHNKSGNIHIHIVVNSVRKETIEKPDFIERENECKAGSKFRNSKLFLNSIRTGVMAICERENLNQVDLLNAAEEKISEREYRKQQREQKKLDTQNAEMEAEGIVPAKKIYQTEKDKIRKAVRKVIHQATTEEEFKKLLKEQGIEVTESRGRWGYKTAALSKTIRARQFGTAFEKEYILSQFGTTGKIQNSRRYNGKLKKIINVQNAINAVDTMKFFMENQNTTVADLLAKKNAAKEKYAQLQADKKPIWDELNRINPMIHHIGAYYATKKFYNAWKQTPPEQREQYEIKFAAELAAYKKSDEFLAALVKDQGLQNYPSYQTFNELKSRKQQLNDALERIESEAAKTLQNIDELDALISNYSTMLDQEIVQEEIHEETKTEPVRNDESR